MPTPDDTAQTPPKETGLTSVASFAGLIAIWLFFITFSVQNFVIPSASMASTLLVGDHVLVDRASLAPATAWARLVPYRPLQRDEPVVFFRPAPNAVGDHDILVKRVIGIPGDRIHLRHRILFRNGVAQAQPFATQPTAANYNPYNDDFPAIPPGNSTGAAATATWSVDLPAHLQGEDLVIPPGHYFVMGDNRANSYDSRYWGLVPEGNLIGRPLVVYWSFNTPEDDPNKTSPAERVVSTLHTTLHFFDETRWRRTLHPIR